MPIMLGFRLLTLFIAGLACAPGAAASPEAANPAPFRVLIDGENAEEGRALVAVTWEVQSYPPLQIDLVAKVSRTEFGPPLEGAEVSVDPATTRLESPPDSANATVRLVGIKGPVFLTVTGTAKAGSSTLVSTDTAFLELEPARTGTLPVIGVLLGVLLALGRFRR